MAEQVPISGFNVPSIPASAQESGQRPLAANMVPGFVPPAAPAPAQAAEQPTAGTFTKAQMDAAIAAALAGKPAASATPAALPVSPGAAITPGELSTASDPVLKSMTSFFAASSNGVDMDRALGKALAYGDPGLIDSAYIREKGGAQAENLLTMAKGIVERVQSQAAAGEAAAFAAAGGKDAWALAAGVFDRSAPAHTKLVIKGMLDSGNPEAIQAAAKTIVDFAKASGQVPNHPQLIQSGAGGAASGTALSKGEFQVLHSKLNQNSPSYAAERGQLFQRRQLGKSLGI